MTVHLVKLCVGAEDISDLATWQAERLAEKKKRKEPQVLAHVTRMTPKRADELLAGGSLYWVMKGVIRCRQKLIGIEPFTDMRGLAAAVSFSTTKSYPQGGGSAARSRAGAIWRQRMRRPM